MKPEFFVGLINLFFVPMLPLCLYYRKNGLPLKPSLELLFHYGATAALIIPIAKAFAIVPTRLLHVPVPVESSYYTLAALITVWLLPALDRLFRSVSIQVEFKEHGSGAEEEIEEDEKAIEKAE